MKVYNLNNDYEFLCDRGISRSAFQWQIKLEMMAWNLIAKIINCIGNLG